METTSFKCHFCKVCNGTGCIGQLPGMGGVRRNENFRLNFDGWEVCRKLLPDLVEEFVQKQGFSPLLRHAPVTGAVENIGYPDEKSFYFDMVSAAHQAGLGLCLGDGTPDNKIKYGIEAVTELKEARAAVFIKPFDNARIFQRIDWASKIAQFIGIDVDAYNIATMRNLVNLEHKTTEQLLEIKKMAGARGLPFAIKGVFTGEDVQLVKEVHPDIIYVSNHGGRVETSTGSTAEFLMQYAPELKRHTGEIWVDGGIRTSLDVATAMALGANQILVGRPFVTALCKDGAAGVKAVAQSLRQL